MSYGKKAIWELVDPLRKGGVFHEIADHYEREYLLSIEPKTCAPNSICLRSFISAIFAIRQT